MDTNQPESSPMLTPPLPPPGIFGTKIPSAVTFAVGVLLFLLPFAEIKCTATPKKNDSSIDLGGASVSFDNTGIGLAFGREWHMNMPGMTDLFENEKKDSMKEMDSNKPNNYAIVALILALLGLGLSFTNGKMGATLNIATGVLAAAALVGLMFDLRKKLDTSLVEKGNDFFGVAEKNPFSLNFTPWFYIAIIAFLVAAFFSYKRVQETR
ncbi:MAG: hypothetical protein Q8941_13040 [Bacteroidota bacterium]|nr:hypothetical protein [Bacteroidota bacterium]